MQLNNIIGFALPPVIDLINSRLENSKLKWLVSMGICVLVGALLNLDKLNNLDVGSVLGNIGIIFVESQATYRLYYEKSQVREKLMDKIG